MLKEKLVRTKCVCPYFLQETTSDKHLKVLTHFVANMVTFEGIA